MSKYKIVEVKDDGEEIVRGKGFDSLFVVAKREDSCDFIGAGLKELDITESLLMKYVFNKKIEERVDKIINIKGCDNPMANNPMAKILNEIMQ